MPRCLIVAGPNGAGKATFARDFLPRDAFKHFVNTDFIAAGISPLDPMGAQLTAGRLFLAELDRHSSGRRLRLREYAQRIDLHFPFAAMEGGGATKLKSST